MIIRHFTLVLATLLLLALTPRALAEPDEAFKLPAIGGYSPVSYFTEGAAQLGNPEFAVEHKGKRYFLTSAEQVEIFNEAPDKYRPRHETCTYSLALGMVRPLNPTHFKIVDGSLLLFHVGEEKNALFEWNQSELSEEELMRRADGNQFLIKF